MLFFEERLGATVESSKLLAWIKDSVPAKIKQPLSLRLSPLTGDAGFRHYYRLNTTPTLMAVFAPPAHEDNLAFVTKALALQAREVRTPFVYAVDFAQGFMLLEDFGDDLYSLHLNNQSMIGLYDNAEQVLLKIQTVAPDEMTFPFYNESLLRAEMMLFPEWFCERLLNISLTDTDHRLLNGIFNKLIASALAQPQVVVHRDYHCRNLMVLPDQQVGVIDFQDGVIGPVTYDLVSLLKDCYLRWPQQLVTQRALGYAAELQVKGMMADVSAVQFLSWFDLMGLQRHIKVLGIFARLCLRDGKERYLDDLPLVIRYTMEVVAQYPELREFKDWLDGTILPQLPSQTWYRNWQTAGEV
jgi:aminoglycoside/choline kinase family phosphotransferase